MKQHMIFFAAGLSAVSSAAHAQQRVTATVSCLPSGAKLTYACEARVSSGGSPLAGLGLEIKPNMPSMPMAHNVPPVAAKETKAPGTYAFSVRLDMYGVWSLSMQISGSREDLIVEALDFQPYVVKAASGAVPAGNAGQHQHGHNHGGSAPR